MLAAPWLCDSCGRVNGSIRYQCQQCRGYNSYDLCDQCIGKAQFVHPNHTFQMVSQPIMGMSTFGVIPMQSYYNSSQAMPYIQPMWSTYVPANQTSVKVTYEYKIG